MANIIQQLEDLKEWGHDPTRYEQRLAFRSTFPYGEYGEVIDVDFDELSTREDEYYRKVRGKRVVKIIKKDSSCNLDQGDQGIREKL